MTQQKVGWRRRKTGFPHVGTCHGRIQRAGRRTGLMKHMQHPVDMACHCSGCLPWAQPTDPAGASWQCIFEIWGGPQAQGPLLTRRSVGGMCQEMPARHRTAAAALARGWLLRLGGAGHGSAMCCSLEPGSRVSHGHGPGVGRTLVPGRSACTV